MKPYYQDERVAVHHGDCLDVLRTLPDASVDAVVTDPPYGLEFMGKDWDAFGPQRDPRTAGRSGDGAVTGGAGIGNDDRSPGSRSRASFGGKRPMTWRCDSCGKRDQFRTTHGDCTGWTQEVINPDAPSPLKPFQDWCELWAAECLRVLKPGGHMLAFGGTRTWHRLACAVEDAGFEVRDSIAWLYGSGFPKSLDVSKAIDKRPGVLRHAEFAAHLKEKRLAAGMGPSDVSAHVVGSRSGACWNWEHHQFPEAKWWPLLRDLLGLDEEVWGPVIAEAERQKIGSGTSGRTYGMGGLRGVETSSGTYDVTSHATPDAERWQGWGTALKPGHEPVVCARKPFSVVPSGGEIDRLHHLLGGLLWLSLSPAKRAELTSPSSPAGQLAGACVSALVSAALDTSPDASDQTATFNSPALASTSLSIASSWSATLGALSARTRTSTTSTASSTTTALRTLNSLLGPITSQTTMPKCGCLLGGPSSPAPSAASSSSDEWARWLHTLSASVPATATEGIALAVASALAQVAGELSDAQAEASSATPTATTEAAASRNGAFEPVVVARKPLTGTVAANVLQHGTGALNIDGCRVGDEIITQHGRNDSENTSMSGRNYAEPAGRAWSGRWPANVVLDETQAAALDEMSGESAGVASGMRQVEGKVTFTVGEEINAKRFEGGVKDFGGASRFFKVAHSDQCDCYPGGFSPETYEGPSRWCPMHGESDLPLDDLDARFRYVAKAPKRERPRGDDGTAHPTVKPLDLMRWLVRLVTPPGGVVLEPFAGSGTTVEACLLEGFRCIAIEKTDEYLPLILARIHRQRDPIAHTRLVGGDLGLFELDEEPA